MRALVVVTIGPVQSYISQARRTQDLWHGSRMLSHLARTGVEMVMSLDDDLVFPDKLLFEVEDEGFSDKKQASVPNRFMFITDNPDSAADKVEKAIRDEWYRIAEETKREFARYVRHGNFIKGKEGLWEQIWERQVEHWLEFYWAATPFKDDDYGDYSETVTNANQAIAARKLLRNFSPVAEYGHKCSLTGEQEALHGGQWLASDIRDKFWESIRVKQRNPALLRRGERLSALSVIKRMAHDANPELQPRSTQDDESITRFPSTSSVSAVLFRAAVVKNWGALQSAVKGYLDSLEALFKNPNTLYFTRGDKLNPEHFPYVDNLIPETAKDDDLLRKFRSLDGDWLYDDTLIERTVKEYDDRANTKRLPGAKQALANLYKEAQKLEITRPSPYLAILALDGDSIGTVVNERHSLDSHREFSLALAEFASEKVGEIIERRYAGRLIYSGGDDVLALLPVAHALDAANAIRKTFTEHMQTKTYEHLTASAGIAFVHRTQGLQRAVESAKSGEHTAKHKYGRDAIVIDLIRRSGDRDRVGMKWQQGGDDMIGEINALIDDFQQDRMSRHLPFEIERIAYEMGGASVPDDARESELKRVLERRTNENMADRDEMQNRWRLFLLAIAEPNISNQTSNWRDAAGWTKLIRFIAQGGAE